MAREAVFSPILADGVFPSPDNRVSIRQGTATIGLQVFQEILGASDQSETMQRHMARAGKTKIEHVIGYGPSLLFRRRQFIAGDDLPEARGSKLPFDGDREDGPPLPWVIMWQGKWRVAFGALLPEDLKLKGYVFWDSKRMVESGGEDSLMQIWWEEREQVNRMLGRS